MRHRDVIARRLTTQRLTSAPLATPADAVRLLGCVQSQERDHAFFSLGMRTRATTYADVLDSYFPDNQFETVIHASSKVCEGSWHWQPVATFKPDSRPARDYESLAEEVLHG